MRDYRQRNTLDHLRPREKAGMNLWETLTFKRSHIYMYMVEFRKPTICLDKIHVQSGSSSSENQSAMIRKCGCFLHLFFWWRGEGRRRIVVFISLLGTVVKSGKQNMIC